MPAKKRAMKPIDAQTLRTRSIETLMAATYIFLSFLSFYCCCYRLPVGVKYAVNVLIMGWAVAAFMIKPRMEDMKFSMQFLLVNFAPYLMFWVLSLGLWIAGLQSSGYILRGSLNIIYMFTNIAYVCAAFYLLGQRAVYYTFVSMTLANTMILLRVAAQCGVGELISEYVVLLVSFANTTGSVVQRMELHDMVFGWGPYMLYFLLPRKEKRWVRLLCLAIAGLYFTISMKRIAAMAIVLALVAGWLYGRIKEKWQRTAVLFLFLVVCVGAYVYISMVHDGSFFRLAGELGIDLMGRKTIYSSAENMYETSPFYIGKGIRYMWEYGQNNEGFSSLHNVYMELFIELGFAGWVFWLFLELYYRNRFITKHFGPQAGVCLIAGIVYIFITYMTDNTLFQFPVNVTYRMVAIAWCHEAWQKHRAAQGDAKDARSRKGEQNAQTDGHGAHARLQQEGEA